MGLGAAWDRFVVGKVARRFVEEVPVMRDIFGWFTDPAHPGRKRGLAATSLVAAEALRGAGVGFKAACAKALIVGAACAVDFTGYASWVEVINEALQTYAVPGVEIVGALVGVWGLIHARMRKPLALVR